MHQSINQCIYPSIHSFINPCMHLFIHLFIHNRPQLVCFTEFFESSYGRIRKWNISNSC
jgi:hypothetical protein